MNTQAGTLGPAAVAKRDHLSIDTGRLLDGVRMCKALAGTTAPATASFGLGQGWTARVLLRPENAEPVPDLDGAVLTRSVWLDWLRQLVKGFSPSDKRYLLKTSSTTLVCRARMPLESGKTLDVVHKRHFPRKLHRRLLAMVRMSRPQRTWQRAIALLNAHIPTARPLAVLERRRFGFLVDSVLVTEYLPNAVDLECLLTVGMRELSPAQARWLKHELADALADFILRIQNAGFLHRDLKALNVIVQWDSAGTERPKISVVDLDGIRKSASARTRGHLRMLMRLNVSVDAFRRVSLTDRVRLLQRYLLRAGRPVCEWKGLWRELAVLSQRKREIRGRHQERSFRKYGRF